ncbi:MAG: magnesium transporter [Bacteroidota bacterium]
MSRPIDSKKRSEQWQELLKKKQYSSLYTYMKEAPPVEVGDFLSYQPLKDCAAIIELFSIEEQASLFEHLQENQQLALYTLIPKRVLADIFANMSSDIRVDFYQKLSNNQKIELLPFLSRAVKQDMITLSIYPRETAGGIMSTDFVALRHDSTVGEALEQMRKDAPSNKMIYYLYVVNHEMEIMGFVKLRELVTASPSAPITDILHDTFIFSEVREDRESVARKIEKYDLVALPVLNSNGQLVGIVSYDDAMDVIRVEQTEDMERFMGIVPDESKDDYLQTSSFQHFKKRISWLIGLFFLSFFASFIMHKYESLLSTLGVLALYLTTINDAGGNAGSQTATVVIRALSLGQVKLKDWLRIVIKECKVALMFALLLSLLAFVKVVFFASLGEFLGRHLALPKEGMLQLAFVVAIALSIQVVVSTLIGAGLPMFITWLGKDPALAASPAITTIVDSTGLFIYFNIALKLLSSTAVL